MYDGFKLDRIPRRYAVEAGKTLSDTWDAARDNFGKYDLWVLGPNGFHRHFKGDLNRLTGTQAAPEVRVCYDVANGNVYVDLMNKGGQLRVHRDTGGLPPGRSVDRKCGRQRQRQHHPALGTAGQRAVV